MDPNLSQIFPENLNKAMYITYEVQAALISPFIPGYNFLDKSKSIQLFDLELDSETNQKLHFMWVKP